jgi:hypothetical protein
MQNFFEEPKQDEKVFFGEPESTPTIPPSLTQVLSDYYSTAPAGFTPRISAFNMYSTGR